MDEAGIEAKRKSKAADKRKRKNAGIEAKAEKQIEESEAVNRGHRRREAARCVRCDKNLGQRRRGEKTMINDYLLHPCNNESTIRATQAIERYGNAT